MNTIFMGTPDFAVPSLGKILSAGYTVSAVFTKPDKPKGRGLKSGESAVKTAAVQCGLRVYQPQTLKDNETAALLADMQPDVIVVVAYGKILPVEILDIPKYFCVNVHASLLPKYRGAAPVQWSVINGEKITGITSMLMNEGLDTGDILETKETCIGENETAGELYKRLSHLGGEVLLQTLKGLENGSLKPRKQDDRYASYAPALGREHCRIDWNEPASAVHNKIRGLYPFLTATAFLEDKMLKIHSARLSDEAGSGEPGEVLDSGRILTVACGDGKAIILETLQAEGKRAMPAADFLRGHKIARSSRFK